MGLKSGEDRYWELKELAERIPIIPPQIIPSQNAESRSSSEREIWAERVRNFADRLREEYGVNDRLVRYIIEEFGLDRS